DDVGVFVEDDDVRANDAALIGRRQRGKLAGDFYRAGLKLLLQPRRQSAVAFELLLEAGREIAGALGQARGAGGSGFLSSRWCRLRDRGCGNRIFPRRRPDRRRPAACRDLWLALAV